ncbi:MAG: hypothetical protein GX029_09965 [Pseudomonadaceae bacterium]|nr:hypothetical protein [Pseudomonadaceae bacterium]
MKNLATTFVGCLVTFFWLSCLADETNAPKEVSDLPNWVSGSIEPFHADLSEWIESSSRSLDGFFGSTDALTIENDSYLRLSYDAEWFEGKTNNHSLGVRFRLDLPTTAERLRLVIENEPEEYRGTLASQEKSLNTSADRSLRGILIGIKRLSSRDKRQHWNAELGAGVKLHLLPDPYVRAITQRQWSLATSPWLLHSDNRISWFNSDGYSARTRWELGRPIGEDRYFRLLTNVQWRETEDTLEYSQAIEFNRRLSQRSVIRYSGVVLGESSSNPAIEDTYIEIRYRRNIHKGFTFLDIAPSLHFPREDDRQSRWALNISLEMYFRRYIERMDL